MRSRIALALLMVFAFGVGVAYADSHERMVVIWTCKLEEGKTSEDVQKANAKWVKHVNAGLEEGEIRSYVLTTVVGNVGNFLYVDTFPSGTAWLASREAMKSEEGQAIEKELEEVASCSSNSLYESEQSLPAD